MHPLAQLVLSRIREFYREPAAIFWVYGFPLLLSVALGIAFSERPTEAIQVDVLAAPGTDRDALQAQIAAWQQADPRLKVAVSEPDAAASRLRTDKTSLLVSRHVPVEGEDPKAAPKWDYQLDTNRPGCVLARGAMDSVLLREANPNAALPAVDETHETGGRYIDYLMPGLIGTNLMGGGLFGVGFVVVDMRVRKLLKRFLATPMRKSDYLLSLMLSRLLFTVIEIALLLGFAFVFFHVQVRGNWFALAALVLLGAVAFTGLGLLLASRAKTIETVSGLMNAAMLPMYVLSGVFFSYERFPQWTHPIIKCLPLTAVNDGLRAVVNDGAGFEALGFPAVVLAGWGILGFVFALKLFRWQ